MIDITKMGVGAFDDALKKAEVGDRITYHIGLHCGGTHRVDAMSAYEDKRVLLFQSRVGRGLFAYIAQKLDSKRKKKK